MNFFSQIRIQIKILKERYGALIIAGLVSGPMVLLIAKTISLPWQNDAGINGIAAWQTSIRRDLDKAENKIQRLEERIRELELNSSKIGVR